MNISIFDVSGPIMVGPSSSHTAGAVKLARIAAATMKDPFCKVDFALHGSFAKTYRGHGTDKALLAGVLGIMEDDERIGQAFELANASGLEYDFFEKELDGVHENSVEIVFYLENGGQHRVVGSSVGGGAIVIRRINEMELEITALLPTLLIRHRDEKGVIGNIANLLSESGINIGAMKLSRKARGSEAFCTIETDEQISQSLQELICKIPEVYFAQAINPPALGDDYV